MELFYSTAPKGYENQVNTFTSPPKEEHVKLDDIFNKKDEGLKPVFTDSTTISSNKDESVSSAKHCEIIPSLTNSLYAIKNFCSSYLTFQNSLDEMLKLDQNNSTNYTTRFTHPINEIKYDLEEIRYSKIQDQLLKMYKHIEIDFNINVIETESILPIFDKIAVKDGKYYIQPEIEQLVNRLILSKIIDEREIIVVEDLYSLQKTKHFSKQFEIVNSMVKLGINDYQMCEHCRFKIICFKHHR